MSKNTDKLHIETHDDFALSPKGMELLQLIDPEIREEDITPEKVAELQKKADGPVRDFIWEREGEKIPISEMDVETLLVVAQHCIRRTELYHRKILFFLEVVEILEEHAQHNYALEIPQRSEDIDKKIRQYKAKQEELEQEMKDYESEESPDSIPQLPTDIENVDRSMIEALSKSVRN